VKEETSAAPASDDVIDDEVTWSESRDGENNMEGDIVCQLKPRDLWDKFHALGTEMIITKSGRLVGSHFLLLICSRGG